MQVTKLTIRLLEKDKRRYKKVEGKTDSDKFIKLIDTYESKK
mgnify:CR=1 FL=1